jgi:hypothetical protein
MTLANKDDARRDLEPLFPLLTTAMNEAWMRWFNNPVAPQMQHKRVRAAVVWNEFLAYMKRELATGFYPGVTISSVGQNIGLLVNGRYYIRFKKGTRHFKSSNFPTQGALDFHDPNVDMFGGVSRLEALYVLDKHEISIDSFVLTQRNNNAVSWVLDLQQQDTASVQELPRMEPSAPMVQEGVARRVIKSRKQGKEKKYANDNGTGASKRNTTRND